MSEEKRWKRGDIGPDGRVFWQYCKASKNGEWWVNQQKYEEKRVKMLEATRRYRRKNYNVALAANRRYRDRNQGKVSETQRRYYEENREKRLDLSRRFNLKKLFAKSFVSNLSEFYSLLNRPKKTIAAILNLTPDEGQTLAELIHELSGYPMELCEQIANPPDPEPETQPEMLDNSPPPVILPDLF